MEKSKKAPSSQIDFDAYTFFAITFGISDLIENYVGELNIISWLDFFLKVTTLNENELDESFFNNNNHNNHQEQLNQQRRVLDIVLYLRQKIQPYVEGRISKEQYMKSCYLEATAIATQIVL